MRAQDNARLRLPSLGIEPDRDWGPGFSIAPLTGESPFIACNVGRAFFDHRFDLCGSA